MSDREIRRKLVRLAHANPGLRADLLPLITRQAINTATQEFAEWALNQTPWAVNDVERFVAGKLKIKTSAPRKKRTGPRWQLGDLVVVKADKHKDQATIAVYQANHGQTGTVVGGSGEDVEVDLDGGGRVTFPRCSRRSTRPATSRPRTRRSRSRTT
jgi:ribosomal protein L21E